MNPFQRAQGAAIETRSQLLGERANQPVSAIELISLIEEVLNIGVELVEKNAPELENGDACLRREEQFIYVRKDVSSEECAELVAHELGHWVLDAGKEKTTVASLVSIANIQGSPGVIKVEAYGSRERQELQANVFGREFLVPRHTVRQLFINGEGPRKVASDIGVPVAIVQQQMLDSILLPIVDDLPLKPLHKPSDDQKLAAHASERFVSVDAGPGTGKTSTLIHRVKYLIEDLHVDPSHILILTFTNKAAFELVERLRATGIERAADIWAGTFHAFGLEFLRKYHDYFELNSDIVVADKLNIITMLSKHLPNITLQHYLRVEDPYDWLGDVVQGIKRLKEEIVSPQQYKQRLQGLECDDLELVARRHDVVTLFEAHEQLLRTHGLIDFVDLVSLPATAIRDDRAKFSALADKFQHILVDEYQDVTEVMVELVRQLAHNAKSLWVVGDVRQAIHHWRGASVKSLMQFEKIFIKQANKTNSSVKKYPLKFNRRSSQEIVDLVTKTGEVHILQKHLPLSKATASRGECGNQPILVSCPSSSVIPEAVASAIKKFQSNEILYSQQAVLCRSTSQVKTMAASLHSYGIPVFYIGELAERPEIKLFLCLMQLLTERQPRSLVGLMTYEGLNLSFDDITKMLEYAKNDLSWQRGRWLYSDVTGLSNGAYPVINTLKKLLDGHNSYSSPWSFLCDLLLEKRIGLPSLDDSSLDTSVVKIALWQFLYSVQSGDGDGKRQTLLRYLRRLQLRQRIGETYSDRELPHEASALNAVRVQTVHSSKGLEYEAVHVGYVEKSSYGVEKPWSATLGGVIDIVPPEVLGSTIDEYEFEQAVERNNLLYVAASRAKQKLMLYEDGNWAYRNRPAPLQSKPIPFEIKNFVPSLVQPHSSKVLQNSLAFGEALSFSQFETYMRCPLQYWYRYGLSLAYEQETNVAVRARFAVMNALKTIASGGSTQSRSTFESAWIEQNLASEAEDPELWNDATTVFERGLYLLSENKGSFEEPETSIGGVSIRFPWILAERKNSKTIFHLIRFSSRGGVKAISLLRPMLSGLDKKLNAEVKLLNLLTTTELRVEPNVRVENTNAMASAKKFIAGDQSPQKGYHCKFCPYITICPSAPM